MHEAKWLQSTRTQRQHDYNQFDESIEKFDENDEWKKIEKWRNDFHEIRNVMYNIR